MAVENRRKGGLHLASDDRGPFTQTAGSLSLINGGGMTAGSVLMNGGTLRGGAGTETSFAFAFGGTGSNGWYKLVDYTSTTFSAGNFQASNVPSGKTATFVVASGSNAVYVQIVPEPATIVLAGMGVVFAGLVARQRRRA